MNITIPENVLTALDILEQNGYSAYAVGGCVRNSLLGKVPYDWDICTSALPEQTMNCFADYRVIPTGVKHGTITVIVENPLEITTFRIDGNYTDNRRPDEVSFTGNIADDLCRRDFTVNAMALDKNGNLTDLYGGREDLQKKLIRCVGNAETRFEEDALRIMRALRFAATLGFEIEEETAKAIQSKKHLLRNIAAERIQKEFTKMLAADCGKILLQFADVIKVFMPLANTSLPNIKLIEATPSDPALRLALLLSDLSAEEAESALRSLKYDNRTIKAVSLMLETKSLKISCERPQIKRLINRFGIQDLKTVLSFLLYSENIDTATHGFVSDTANDIIQNNECCTLSSLAVNGSDISSLGIFKQSNIGKVLYALLEKVMDEKAKNEKKELIELAKKLKY